MVRVNIEPLPDMVALLKSERPRDVCLGLAVGSSSSLATLYKTRPSGLSTLTPKRAQQLVDLGYLVEKTSCRVATLREICERHVTGEIHFLKVDAEGGESEVIQGADWEQFRPKLVVVEAVVAVPGRASRATRSRGRLTEDQSPTWKPILFDACYELCYFDGLNRFYVRSEDSQLTQAFELPPNVWDSFVPHSVKRLEAENDRLRKEQRRLESRHAALLTERDD